MSNLKQYARRAVLLSGSTCCAILMAIGLVAMSAPLPPNVAAWLFGGFVGSAVVFLLAEFVYGVAR